MIRLKNLVETNKFVYVGIKCNTDNNKIYKWKFKYDPSKKKFQHTENALASFALKVVYTIFPNKEFKGPDKKLLFQTSIQDVEFLKSILNESIIFKATYNPVDPKSNLKSFVCICAASFDQDKLEDLIDSGFSNSFSDLDSNSDEQSFPAQ